MRIRNMDVDHLARLPEGGLAVWLLDGPTIQTHNDSAITRILRGPL